MMNAFCRWPVTFAVSWVLLTGVLLLAAPRVTAMQGGTPVVVEQGDLHVEILSVQRTPRLVGDMPRSRDDDYLVMKLNLRAAPGKTLRVPPRATFAVIPGDGAPATAAAKYPSFLIGYFSPSLARPVGNNEAVTVDERGVGFTIAAEVPKTLKSFRLAVQKPVAEAELGRPRSTLPAAVPLTVLAGGPWAGQVATASTQDQLVRRLPGSTRADNLRPRRNAFYDVGIDLKNTSDQPRALAITDLILTDEAGQRAMSPMGVIAPNERAASSIGEGKAVAPQAAAVLGRPVWDVARNDTYLLRIYGAPALAVLPAAQTVAEMAVDTGEGHFLAGEENRLVGRLEKAMQEYMTVVQKFPDSDAVSDAEARMADIEVATVFGQKFVPLPPPTASGKASAANIAEVRIENATGLVLTVYYSGPTSKKLSFQVGETKTFQIANGAYKVAAKVADPTVLPFAGSFNASAGSIYQSSFIIRRAGGG